MGIGTVIGFLGWNAKMASAPAAQTRNCVQCGRSIAFDANVCQYCGHDYRVAAVGPAPPKQKSVLSIVGGAMLVVAGLLGLGIGAILLTIDFSELDAYGISVGVDMLEDLLRTCGIIMVILGLITVLGGVFGVLRKHFGLAVLGGVIGLLLVATPYALGSILSLIGLVLVIVSKKDFD